MEEEESFEQQEAYEPQGSEQVQRDFDEFTSSETVHSDNNLEKKPFPQVPYKVTEIDSDSVISDNSTESNLNMKHLVHEQQVLAQAQQELVQQEKLLQSQVRQVRLGVLEFMQTCLGQLVLQTNDKYGSQHILNHIESQMAKFMERVRT